MKKILFLFLISALSMSLFAQPKVKVKVIYFHSTHRCPTCLTIETNVRKTLDQYYRQEMEKGIITLSVINIDEKANKKIAEDYQVYSSSLFLVKMINGKEDRNNLTDFAFMNARNETKFILELKSKIDKMLK